MPPQSPFGPALLDLDCAAETTRISDFLRKTVFHQFKKKGLVVAVSGGVDSSLVAALAAQSLGKDHVLGLLMPERHSSSDTLRLSRLLTDHLGINSAHQEITPILEALGCYRLQEEAIRGVVPDYASDCKSKIVLPSVLESHAYRLFSVVVQYPDGRTVCRRLDLKSYQSLVAATNLKQRTRKLLEYYHDDQLNFAVAGTPNLLEYDQGFFVKHGDGAADVKPIAHLYKSQVYQLAEFLKLPGEIRNRPPTTDTYSLPQSQEEFYFSLPYEKMDLVLYGRNNGFDRAQIGKAIGLTVEQVDRVFRDIESKRKNACYLHAAPLLVEEL